MTNTYQQIRRMAFQVAIMLCTTLPLASAFAEKADSLKPIDLYAEKADAKSNVRTLSGSVLISRGTLTIKADKAVMTEAASGYQSAVLTGAPGKQVFFRQKRDGGPDLWVEGQADRIEYDEKTELVKFISKARIKYLEGKKVTQEQEGEFLSYDSLNDVFVGTNTSSGKTVPGGGLLKITIQPKTEPKSEEQKK